MIAAARIVKEEPQSSDEPENESENESENTVDGQESNRSADLTTSTADRQKDDRSTNRPDGNRSANQTISVTDRQEANRKADQTIRMADRLEASRRANQTNNVANRLEANSNVQRSNFLELKCSIRTQLANNLMRLSDILQEEKPLAKKSLKDGRKMTRDSILLLVDLSPFKPSAKSSAQMLKLQATERIDLISHLINIKDAVLSNQEDDEEDESSEEEDDESTEDADEIESLIIETEKIILKLMKLRQESNDLAGGSARSAVEPASKRQRSRWTILNDSS